MKTISYIVIAVVLVIAAILVYFLFFKDKVSGNASNSDDTLGTPIAETPPIFTGDSTLVNQNDVESIGAVSFANMTDANIASYNVLTAPGSNPSKIHIVVPFNFSCQNFLWYRSWLYSYTGYTQDAQTGNKTCYYAIDKSKLPVELVVQSSGDTCSNFKLFVSGVEYRFDSSRIVGTGLGSALYCKYKKI